MSGAPPTGRSGFALVVALAMILSLAVLALGMLGVGAREALLGHQLETAIALRTAAESGARARVAAWSTRDAMAIAIGDARAVRPAPDLDLTIQRLDRTLFLVRAEASGQRWEAGRSAGPAVGRAAMMVRVLDPAAIEARFAAAATVGSARIEGGLVSGTDGCPDGGPRAPAIRAAGEVVIDGPATVRGEPPVQPTEAYPPAPDSADPLAPPLAQRLADRAVGPGSVAPEPRLEGGACAPGPGSWGSPVPTHACHPRLPLVFARGPLAIEGGQARAVLVVDGDLTIDGPLRFEGVIAVSGRLAITGDASVRGGVVADRLVVSEGALIHDACIVRAAASAPALDRAFRPAHGWWVPAY